VVTWQVEDDEGAAWRGILVVTTLPEPGFREAFLRVHRSVGAVRRLPPASPAGVGEALAQ
jgi:hypothetical protein